MTKKLMGGLRGRRKRCGVKRFGNIENIYSTRLECFRKCCMISYHSNGLLKGLC